MSAAEVITYDGSDGGYVRVSFPQSEHYSCDGELLNRVEVKDLITQLITASERMHETGAWR